MLAAKTLEAHKTVYKTSEKLTVSTNKQRGELGITCKETCKKSPIQKTVDMFLNHGKVTRDEIERLERMKIETTSSEIIYNKL